MLLKLGKKFVSVADIVCMYEACPLCKYSSSHEVSKQTGFGDLADHRKYLLASLVPVKMSLPLWCQSKD